MGQHGLDPQLRSGLDPMNRFLNEGQNELQIHELTDFWQDDGSVAPSGTEEDELPEIRPYPATKLKLNDSNEKTMFFTNISTFKSKAPHTLAVHSRIRDVLRQQCELHRINCHTLFLTAGDYDAFRTLPDCGDIIWSEEALTSGSGILIFLAPGDSNMFWFMWPEKPIPGGSKDPVFTYIQNLVLNFDVRLCNLYAVGTPPHKAVYELFKYGISVARAPNQLQRTFGNQAHDVIEYARYNPRVTFAMRNVFQPYYTPWRTPSPEISPEGKENYHPDDRMEKFFQDKKMYDRVPEEEEDLAYWELFPPRIHPGVRAGGPIPSWLLKIPGTEEFWERGEHGAMSYYVEQEDGYIVSDTPGGPVEPPTPGSDEYEESDGSGIWGLPPRTPSPPLSPLSPLR